MDKIIYSIIVPVYNEQESLRPLTQEIFEAMRQMPGGYEIVFVNDASGDHSLQIIRDLCARHETVHLIDLDSRHCQTLALQRGIEAARGDILITMDADLQNDPSDIPQLIDKISQGFDVCCGWRRSRQDKFFKMLLSKTGNIFQRLFNRCPVHDVSCTLRAYRSKCFKDFSLSWEGQHRFIPLILSLRGWRITEIVCHHRPRKFGHSKYTHKRIFKVVRDFIKVLRTSR